ncbi:MAG: transcriptional repressor [Firmicutes bacterium]|nr:transcriptional repressor [Bacillota bacterium]
MKTDSLEAYRDALTTAGFRFTRQREAVIRVLAGAGGGHLSAEEIAQEVRATDGPGLATVYRTLSMLEGIGIVRSIDLGDGRARYEISDAPEHHHHHLICTVCGRVEEVEHDLLHQIEEHVKARHGFAVRNHSLKIYGICSVCRGTGGSTGS